MKIKTFRHAALTMLIAAATVVSSFAQQTVVAVPETTTTSYTYAQGDLVDGSVYAIAGQQDTTYQKQMRKLRQQMQDLQKQMNNLRTEEYRKNADQYRKSAEKLREKYRKMDGITYAYSDSVSGLSKGLGVMVVPKTSFNFNNNGKSFSFNEYGDDYIKKKIQSGEVKEKVKNYTKSYNVDRDDKIQIDNKFGKITVNTWNKNEVKVEVQIKADADDDDAAQKLLDQVNISDSKDASTVSFKTKIDQEDNGNWGTWFKLGKNHVRKIEVNYVVYMPSKSGLIISNKYGSTELPDLVGKVTINNAYGSLIAKSLTNNGNDIRVRYGSAKINNLVGSDVDVAYGSLIIDESNNLNATVSYGSAKIGKLKTSGIINAKFSGTVQVADVDKNLKNLSVNSSYSSVKLGISNDQNADFDVTVKYGSFNYGGVPVVITTESPDREHGATTTKTYKGKVGKGNSDQVITVKSTFGSVKFD